MISIANLCALLDLAHGPGVDRSDAEPLGLLLLSAGDHPLHQRRVRLLRDYAPFDVFARRGDSVRIVHRFGIVCDPMDESWSLHLNDPGTVNLLKVALALALGLDPGPLGVGCLWRCEDRDSEQYYTLLAVSGGRAFFNRHSVLFVGWGVHAPEVATEPDPIKALMRACQHTISEKR